MYGFILDLMTLKLSIRHYRRATDSLHPGKEWCLYCRATDSLHLAKGWCLWNTIFIA
jgi:hypothetical protein